MTEPVPVTLAVRAGGLEGGGRVVERGREMGGREVGITGSITAGLISTVCGSVDSVCVGSGAGGRRVGTAVMLSVFTRREETLVTVPDCTVRPEEGREEGS